MGTRFTAKWGPEVRRRVADAAFDPTRPTARAIHQGLVAAATGENGALSPTDIPPLATVATWVSEHRRDARDVLAGNPEQLDQIAADLMRKLRDQAKRARSPNEITMCAKAAREVAGLHRDLNRPEPNRGGARARARLPNAPQARDAESTPQDDAERDFLQRLEADERV